ncbi:hypothetical protein HOC80_00635 [archaeon]|nr:hypothetical protein [archaeon]
MTRLKKAYEDDSGACTEIGGPETITEEGIVRRAKKEGWAESLLNIVRGHHRVRNTGTVPRGTVQNVQKQSRHSELDPDFPRDYALISRATEQLHKLGFGDLEKGRILSSLPEFISIEPVSTKSANPVFSVITEDGRYLFVKKMPLRGGSNVEMEVLNILSGLEEKGRYSKRFFPNVAPETFSDSDSLYLITELPKLPVIDASLIIEERMRVLGRLHGLSPAIQRDLVNKGEGNLLPEGKNYGDPKRLMHEFNGKLNKEYRFSPTQINRICVLYNRFGIDLRDASRDNRHRRIVSPDAKDENWDSTIHLDLEKMRWGARPESFPRVLYDKFAYDNNDMGEELEALLMESLHEESITVEADKWMPKENPAFIEETIDLTLGATLIDMVRLLHYNITTDKVDAMENTRVYYSNLVSFLEFYG